MHYFSTIFTQGSSINQNNTLINKLFIRILIVKPLMKSTHTSHAFRNHVYSCKTLQLPVPSQLLPRKLCNYKMCLFFLTHSFIVETSNTLMINSLGYLLSSYLHLTKKNLSELFTHHSFKFTSFSSFGKHFCMPSLDAKYCWALVIQKSER